MPTSKHSWAFHSKLTDGGSADGVKRLRTVRCIWNAGFASDRISKEKVRSVFFKLGLHANFQNSSLTCPFVHRELF